NDGADRRDGRRSPKERQRAGRRSMLFLTYEPLEDEQNADDVDREMQREHVQAAEEIDEIHARGLSPCLTEAQKINAENTESKRKALEHPARVDLEDLSTLRRRELRVAVDVALRIVEVMPRLGVDAAHGADHLRCD